MSNKRGFTLIEVIVSLALLGIIALGFLTALSGNFSFLLNTKDITEDVFLAQKTLEAEIESVKADLDSGVTPAGAKADYTLFDEVYSGTYEITVSGYPREVVIGGNREVATVVAESRMPVFTVPVANSSNLVLRLSGATLPDNFEYVNLANLSLRANSSVTENGVFLVNKHEWYVSRAGFNIPMVSWGLVDKDFDLGRLYPLFPNDYIPVPIKSNSDQLSQSDFNNLLNDYAGRHIIYTITPYAISGKKGATIFSNPVFLTGPTVRNDLVLHLDASLVSKEDMSSVQVVGSDLYVKQWKNIVSDVNNAVQANPSFRPKLAEVQYPEDLFVWGKSTGGNGVDMAISSFNPSDADELTVFIVAKSDALNSPGTEIIAGGSGSDDWSFGWGNSENLVFTGDSPAYLDTHEGLDGKWYVFTLVATADDVLKIRMDGEGVAADHDGTYSDSLDLSPFNINWDDTEIAEILVYGRDLSFDAGTDMLAVETYLQTKYDPDPDDINISIVFLKPLAPVTVYQNQTYTLPSTAKALMSNGMTHNVDVTWSNAIDTSVTGTQFSMATADMDNTKTVILTVNVVSILDFVKPLTPITSQKGKPCPLPATLPAVYSDGVTRETEVTWSGTVEILDIGEHTLTATAVLDSSKTVDLQVTIVPVAVTGVELNQSALSLVRGSAYDLIATVLPVDAVNKNISWVSSDPSIATVNSSGRITALIPGTTVVTVTTEEGGLTDTCDVTVLPIPAVSVDLNKSSTSLIVGESETLIATVLPSNADNKNVTWSSSNTGIATVNVGGTVSAVGPGSATITVRTVDGGFTDTCVVTVIQPVTGVTLAPASVTLNVGNTQTLTATVLPADASNKNVTWLSSNSSVASVSSGGVVTAVAAGSATITVRTVDGGFTDTCVVTVIQPVTGVTLSPDSITLNVGQTQTLTATVSPANATNKNVTWSSSNSSVASVSSGGVVTGVAVGSATITVRTVDGGFTDTCSVTVPRPRASAISDGYRNRFTLTFNKSIQSADTPGYTDTVTNSGVYVTCSRSSDYPNNTNITVNVTATDGTTNTVVVKRNGTNWSIVSQL